MSTVKKVTLQSFSSLLRRRITTHVTGANALNTSLARQLHASSQNLADATKQTPQEASPDVEKRFGWILRLLGYYTDESKVIRYSRVLYDNVKQQALNPFFGEKCGMENDLRHRLMLTGLHIWLVLVRLRREGDYGKDLSQGLYDVFWEDMTKTVKDAGVKGRILTDQLSRLQEAFYGTWHALDEGLESSDPALAGALWRNLLEMRKDVNMTEIEKLTNYVRLQVAYLDQLNSAAVHKGIILWQDEKKLTV